jgi:hypothetical protein
LGSPTDFVVDVKGAVAETVSRDGNKVFTMSVHLRHHGH